MKKTSLLNKTLPAFALALALGACGGGGGGDNSNPNPNNPSTPPQTASVVSCFTVPGTVSYNITASGVPSGQVTPSTGTSGPMSYNGRNVTGQTLTYVNAVIQSDTMYWQVTDSGVAVLNERTIKPDGTVLDAPSNVTLPQNMSLGQTVGGMTLVEFKDITLAGKTFSNACHFKTSSTDDWYAQGYGLVKRMASGVTIQYNGDIGGSSSPSITACFTATKTVNFAAASSGVPSGSVAFNRSATGPTNYNGQAVTGQTFFYPGTTASQTNYWTVTSSGITFIAKANFDGSITHDSLFYPQNINPGQTVTDSNNDAYVFVGFELVGLAGKTFSNTCHIRDVAAGEDRWYAQGYGLIKQIGSGGTVQYNGDL